MAERESPNIIVTGTPGVGKSSLCEVLAQNTGLKHLSVNDVVKERRCYDEWDEELKTFVVDEDKLLDAVDEDLEKGGQIIDWHACDLFPESKIDLVVVLRASTEVLFDRLKARNYPEIKLQENMDSEIMQVLVQEARDAYDSAIVVELDSNSTDDMDSNLERIETWLANWKASRGSQNQT